VYKCIQPVCTSGYSWSLRTSILVVQRSASLSRKLLRIAMWMGRGVVPIGKHPSCPGISSSVFRSGLEFLPELGTE
jgi:hypothetical protein